MRAALVLVLGATLAAAGCSSNVSSNSSSSGGSDQGSSQPAPSFSQFTDIPVPDGAHMNVGDTLLLGQGDNWVGRLVFTMRFTSVPTVFDFYKSEMPSYKWQEISSVRADISVMTYRRGDRIATVQIEDANLGIGTEVIITMGPANGAGNPATSSDQYQAPPPPPPQGVPPAAPVTSQPLNN
jgi:hypothetical protein